MKKLTYLDVDQYASAAFKRYRRQYLCLGFLGGCVFSFFVDVVRGIWQVLL